MAELSSQFASISPGMDTDTAQSGLVSIMKAWDVDVDDVKRNIMDNINTLGKNKLPRITISVKDQRWLRPRKLKSVTTAGNIWRHIF